MGRPKRVAYKVYRVLREVRVASPGDIARLLGMDYKSVYSALQTLVKNGYVEKAGNGVYMVKKLVW